jgi:hypothetical protein
MDWLRALTGFAPVGVEVDNSESDTDMCNETDTGAVLVKNEDTEWELPPVPVRAGLRAMIAPVRDRHKPWAFRQRAAKSRPPPTACRPIPRRVKGREQMRGKAGAGGGKWVSSR